jgi:hypothetical protein
MEARIQCQHIDCFNQGFSVGWGSTIWLVNSELPARYVNTCFLQPHTRSEFSYEK